MSDNDNVVIFLFNNDDINYIKPYVNHSYYLIYLNPSFLHLLLKHLKT